VSQPEPIPKWRLVLYAFIAVGGAAGIEVALQQPFMFVAVVAVLVGAFVVGFGLLSSKASKADLEAARRGQTGRRLRAIIVLLAAGAVLMQFLLHKK